MKEYISVVQEPISVVSSDGLRYAAGAEDGTITIWDSRKGDALATAGADGSLRLYTLQAG